MDVVRQLDERTFIGSQIAPSDIPQLSQFGFGAIINNRPDNEEPGQASGAEIRAAAEAAGMTYRFVPISTHIGPDQVEAMSEALAEAAGKVLAYCRSGRRAGLIWAVARRQQGMAREEIEAAAHEAGLDLSPIASLL